MFRINAAIAILFAFSSSAFADTTCDLLAKNVPQDVLIEGSALQQFQYQNSRVRRCNPRNKLERTKLGAKSQELLQPG
jgi:hypothetical protein